MFDRFGWLLQFTTMIITESPDSFPSWYWRYQLSFCAFSITQLATRKLFFVGIQENLALKHERHSPEQGRQSSKCRSSIIHQAALSFPNEPFSLYHDLFILVTFKVLYSLLL